MGLCFASKQKPGYYCIIVTFIGMTDTWFNTNYVLASRVSSTVEGLSYWYNNPNKSCASYWLRQLPC